MDFAPELGDGAGMELQIGIRCLRCGATLRLTPPAPRAVLLEALKAHNASCPKRQGGDPGGIATVYGDVPQLRLERDG